ncbi:hypothetical protein [Vibrio phage BONAISHI]|nr:hypothetical protein [Vibrio phage BONAISHI]
MYDNLITLLIVKNVDGVTVAPWVVVDPGSIAQENILLWDQTNTYAANELVISSGDNEVYYTPAGQAANTAWADGDWTLVDTHKGYVQEFDENADYLSDDLVYRDGDLYLSNKVHTGAWVDANWDIVNDASVIQDLFVYDDDSATGTRTILAQAIKKALSAIPVHKRYDTIIGVGASTTNGTFKLNNIWNDKDGNLVPFRGTNFDSQASPGTTLSYIKDQIADSTALANGETLFLFFGGLNDCNTYLSAGGVGDGAAGTVTAWSDMTEEQRTTADTLTREIIAELKQHGDVAITSLHWVDAKGQLSALPDKGVTLHTGSWNDEFLIPLCKELTPMFFDEDTQRPVFDLYTFVKDNPDLLDDDNLHFYNDDDYKAVDGGYPDGNGSHRVREYIIDQLELNGNIKPEPFDATKYTNRVLINIGNETAINNRPMYRQLGNNFGITAGSDFDAQITKAFKSELLDPGMRFKLATVGGNYQARLNNNTDWVDYGEDLMDPNLLSGGCFIVNTRQMTATIEKAGKGTISLAGLYTTSAADDYVTQATITDDNGSRTVTYKSAIDGSAFTGDFSEHIGTLDYDCSNGADLVITFDAVGTESYSGISGIMLDME